MNTAKHYRDPLTVFLKQGFNLLNNPQQLAFKGAVGVIFIWHSLYSPVL